MLGSLWSSARMQQSWRDARKKGEPKSAMRHNMH
jgi:hypothetical protein